MSVTKVLTRSMPVRVWVNAPSTLQSDHKFHGRNGLAILEYDTTARLFFCDGPIVSILIDTRDLSLGWK